jgi:thioesterase domain-containing protein
MARRLRESGDEVGLVGLFDTTMSRLRWPLRVWLSIAARQFRTWPGAIRDRLRGYRTPGRKVARLPRFLQAAPARVLRVATTALVASARYRPGYYPGELTLFSPLEREPGLPSLQSIWRKHARALSIVETAGTHWTMLAAPNAESTAACLTGRLPGR